MIHRVVKPFPFSENGFTLVDLNVGDERDFGLMADGLVAEGWVEVVDVADEAGKADAEPVATKPEPRNRRVK
ncbi:hypothetical protein ABID08_000710 [Rhizobium binae]|uniref:Uncharacterized protein n=1 Tax=Rhizobium binae TaxID=1138190 RepID=A0ABV2MAE9_9HYPH|nr:hypothetical protein [Rhizobium binae]MBX4992280.1 hypothetical protein [Rhizobium binae]NKL52418.1 hypothetical protein [Rhizobium leguminosarum bv. viciae]QSY80752.1 hypothetical protein J2J99_13610 [Rhizobium binae]